MPSKPIIVGNSVGTTSLKKWMSLLEALVVLLAVLSSHQLDHSSCTSWISVPRRFVEEAMSWKVEERS